MVKIEAPIEFLIGIIPNDELMGRIEKLRGKIRGR